MTGWPPCNIDPEAYRAAPVEVTTTKRRKPKSMRRILAELEQDIAQAVEADLAREAA